MAADLIVQYAFATPSSAGSTTVVAAQAGQRIVVLQICVITSLANNVKLQSNGTTDLTATFPLAQNGGFVLPNSDLGWFSTAIGESLTFNQTNGTPTAVQVVWCPRSV